MPPPPHDFDTRKHRFRDARTGRTISRVEVRKLIYDLTEQVQKDAKAIAARLERGAITVSQFEVEMRELIRSGHIIAASVGKGGRSRMTARDWSKVGTRLKREYGYLAKFSRKIGSGKISKAVTPWRAQKYADSVRMSWHETMRTDQTKDSVSEIRVRLITNSEEGCEECAADEARGWVPVEDMGELGTRICGNFCKCDLEFSDDAENSTS